MLWYLIYQRVYDNNRKENYIYVDRHSRDCANIHNRDSVFLSGYKEEIMWCCIHVYIYVYIHYIRP